MGLFKNIFGTSEDTKKEAKKSLPWIALSSVAQLNEIEKKSASKTQVIFKHSTTCGISRMVLNMFTSGYDLDENQLDLYFLDLHQNREVSNEVGYKFQVIHQSPQLLVIKNGTAVYDTSHGAINEVDLKKYL